MLYYLSVLMARSVFACTGECVCTFHGVSSDVICFGIVFVSACFYACDTFVYMSAYLNVRVFVCLRF